MKLHIENIAKIEKADIKIDGITVLAGENSTGKSTVSKVLYCIYETFYNLESKIIREKKSSLSNLLERNLRRKVSASVEDEELEFSSYISLSDLREITDMIMAISKNLPSEEYTKNIKACLEKSDYIFEDFNLLIERIQRINAMTEKQVNGALMNRCMNLEFNSQFLPLFSESDKNKETIIDLTIKDDHITMIYNKFDKTFDVKNYVPITYEVIYLDNPYLIDALDKQSIYRNRRYNRNVISHENKMRNLIARESVNPKVSIFDEILDNETFKIFEDKLQELLNGDFVDFEEQLRFKENGIDEPVRVSNLSMGSKSLAIILKLIKSGYIMDKGIIILDEPEIHLHPKWQLYFAEILVMMQKELNLHILINTHSPYFINALEVYSIEYDTASKYSYYLASLNNNKALFEDVTSNTQKIYKLLAEPLRKLNDMMYDYRRNAKNG